MICYGDLFDDDRPPPIVRNTDPEVSHSAAGEYTASGRRKSDCDRVLQLINAKPGHTAAEYSDFLRTLGVNWYRAARMTTKRISDLCAGDPPRVRAGTPRKCSVTKKTARTYYPS